MTLYQICKEVYDIIVGLYNGTIKYEFNKYMAAMNVGHPGELLEHILASIDYDVVEGKEISLERVKNFTKELVEFKKEYEVEDLSVVVEHLRYYIKGQDKVTLKKLYFGNYPQTEIKDETLIRKLNEKVGTLPTKENTYKWTDYGYYINGKIESFMYYIDIELDEGKYRGVYFTQYRPYDAMYFRLSDECYQHANGYDINTVYWFKYEPIKWNVLKTENGKSLIISELVLDSQDYNYTDELRIGTVDYLGNKTTAEVYANNYMYSHIRGWLNTTFYESAFNESEKEKIETTIVDNSINSTGYPLNEYACSDTCDKLFLFSYQEVKKYYISDKARLTTGSDYAKSQGLYLSIESSLQGNSNYWLRTPYFGSWRGSGAEYIGGNGFIDYIASKNDWVCRTIYGVRPTCWIKF